MNTFTIEDCIEMLAGYSAMGGDFLLAQEDATIVKSIARQVMRGTALTDRQLALMQAKLKLYHGQFNRAGIDVRDSLDNLRRPLRTIDRSKTVKIVHDARLETEYIEVKFPFKKSEAAAIDVIVKQSKDRVLIPKPSQYHFPLSEMNVKLLLDYFLGKDSFEIDPRLITIYDKIREMIDHKEDYVSRISGLSFENVHPRAIGAAERELGPLTEENKIKYADRKLRYGILEVDGPEPQTLAEKIAYRQGIVYSSKLTEESFEPLLEALIELDRFPLLVSLERNSEDIQLEELTNFFAGKIPVEQQSVLFRTDSSRPKFNELVHERNLNNWVDENTKVVYVSKKLPKVLLKSDWRPVAVIEYTGFILDSGLASFVRHSCDLVVHREGQESLFRKHSRHHAIM